MNKETLELIDKLSNKLGTTAEHLWSILVRQAPIDATINLVQCIICIIVIGISLKYIIKKTSGKDPEWEDEGKVIAWILWLIVSIGLFVAIIGSLNDVINGYFNPEYWAFKQIWK